VIECLGREELMAFGVYDIKVKEPLAWECMQLAREGLIDVRDALYLV
jgi:hypothetical protein